MQPLMSGFFGLSSWMVGNRVGKGIVKDYLRPAAIRGGCAFL